MELYALILICKLGQTDPSLCHRAPVPAGPFATVQECQRVSDAYLEEIKSQVHAAIGDSVAVRGCGTRAGLNEWLAGLGLGR